MNVIDTFLLNSNGSVELGANSVLDVGTLAGSGFIAGSTSSTIMVNELLSPGMSPGQLEFTGSLMLGSGATTMIELGGLGAGQFDQIFSLSGLTLDGNLDVSLFGGFTLADGMDFTIFDVIGSSTGLTSGQFTGLNEGSLVGNFGGTNLYISYFGGNGNDVSLFTSAVPEPSSLAIIALAVCGMTLRRQEYVDRFKRGIGLQPCEEPESQTGSLCHILNLQSPTIPATIKGMNRNTCFTAGR